LDYQKQYSGGQKMIRKTLFAFGCAIFLFGVSNGYSQVVSLDANGFEVGDEKLSISNAI
jgi:hypothetical protein